MARAQASLDIAMGSVSAGWKSRNDLVQVMNSAANWPSNVPTEIAANPIKSHSMK